MLSLFNFFVQAGDQSGPKLDSITSAPVALGFTIPDFNQVLTFMIRIFFIMSGLIALLYLLIGAMAWITSGGNKESVDKAREKIQAALVGVILLFVVLAIVSLLENLLGIGMGITKNIQFPVLIKPN